LFLTFARSAEEIVKQSKHPPGTVNDKFGEK